MQAEVQYPFYIKPSSKTLRRWIQLLHPSQKKSHCWLARNLCSSNSSCQRNRNNDLFRIFIVSITQIIEANTKTQITIPNSKIKKKRKENIPKRRSTKIKGQNILRTQKNSLCPFQTLTPKLWPTDYFCGNTRQKCVKLITFQMNHPSEREENQNSNFSFKTKQ